MKPLAHALLLALSAGAQTILIPPQRIDNTAPHVVSEEDYRDCQQKAGATLVYCLPPGSPIPDLGYTEQHYSNSYSCPTDGRPCRLVRSQPLCTPEGKVKRNPDRVCRNMEWHRLKGTK